MWVFEWTGGQFLPAIKDASLVYQQLHRYAFAAELLRGKTVLDAEAGSHLGPAMLARAAASVTGVVSDEHLAQRSNEKYGKPNLQFVTGPLSNVTAEAGRFDAVVWFDSGRKHPDPPLLKRFLKPGGLLVVSTAGSTEALRDSLGPHFKNVLLFGQGVRAVSCMWPLGTPMNTATDEIVVGRNGTGEFTAIPADRNTPAFTLAIACDAALATAVNASVLIDEGNELLSDLNKAIQTLEESQASQTKTLLQNETLLGERTRSLASVHEALAWQKNQTAVLNDTRAYLEREVSHYVNAVASNMQALEWRASQVQELEAGVREYETAVQTLTESVGNLNETIRNYEKSTAELHNVVAKLHSRLSDLEAELEKEAQQLRWRSTELDNMKASTGWRFILKIRSMRDRLLPPGSSRYRVYEKVIGLARSRAAR